MSAAGHAAPADVSTVDEDGMEEGTDPAAATRTQMSAADAAAVVVAAAADDVPLGIVGRDLRFLAFSGELARIFRTRFGADLEVGRHLGDRLPEREREAVLDLAARAFAGEVVRGTLSDGGDPERTYETTWTPLRLPDGRVEGVVAGLQDVTGQLEARETMRRLAEMRDRAEEVGRVGSWELDLASSSMVGSPGMFRLWDWDPEDLDGDLDGGFGRMLKARVHPGDLPRLAGGLAAIRAGTDFATIEFRVVHRDGSVHVLRSVGTLEGDEDGRPVRLRGFQQDVTEQRATEDALKERDTRQSLLLADIAQAVWEADADGLVVTDSPSWRAYTGLGVQEWLGESWVVAIHPEDRELALRRWREGVATEQGIHMEHRLRAPDGSYRWTQVRAVPLRDAHGAILKWVGMNIDIHARKVAELEREAAAARLATSEEHFRSLYEAMRQGVVFQDAEGRITSANKAAERILGLTLDQLQGRTSSDPRWRAMREDGSDFPGEEHPAMEALRSGRRVEGVRMGVYHPAEDATRWLLVDAVPQFRPGEETPYQVFTVFTDVTGQAAAAQEIARLQAMRDLAERVGRAGSVRADLTTGEQLWSPEVYRLLDVPSDTNPEARASLVAARTHPDDRKLLTDPLEEIAATGHTRALDFRIVWRDGSEHIMHREGIAEYDAGGDLVAIIGYMQDVTGLREAERQLRLAETAKAAEFERRRLARDLHDSVTQNIYSANLVLDVLPGEIVQAPQEALDDVQLLRRLVRAALGELRTLLYELRPETLTSAGLGMLLERLGDVLAGAGTVQVHTAAADLDLPDDVHVTFYRVAQEALNNVGKHAMASHVSAVVEADGDGARLVVHDDGEGYDVAATPEGMGAGIMRERAHSIGAALAVRSAPGAGTTVTLTWRPGGCESEGGES